jgi:putative membrane protein
MDAEGACVVTSPWSFLEAAHGRAHGRAYQIEVTAMMSGYGSAMGGGWGLGMGFGWIVPIVVIGLVVWAVIAFARSRAGGAGNESAAPDRSLAVLKERYARGELDSDTFQRMRAELER